MIFQPEKFLELQSKALLEYPEVQLLEGDLCTYIYTLFERALVEFDIKNTRRLKVYFLSPKWFNDNLKDDDDDDATVGRCVAITKTKEYKSVFLGACGANHSHIVMTLNVEYIYYFYSEYCNDVIPHELAHAVHKIAPKEKILHHQVANSTITDDNILGVSNNPTKSALSYDYLPHGDTFVYINNVLHSLTF